MRRFVKTGWFKALMILLAILIIFVILAAVLGARSSPASAVAGTAEQPFARVTSVLGRGFEEIGHFFTRSSTYEKRIDELEGQVTQYQKELADYQETKEKLSNYESFDDLKAEHPDYQAKAATVIGKDSSNFFGTFILNKGQANGIRVNDPVICGQGQLVGVVTKVTPTYCVVTTILDPNLNASAYEIRTGENGYVTNDASLRRKGYCMLAGLDRTTQINKGGVVCTAGIGGIYPRDLVIGTVIDVRDSKRDISSYAVIKPNVKISEVSSVLIITHFSGQGISVASDLSDEQQSAEEPGISSGSISDVRRTGTNALTNTRPTSATAVQ
ncbi:MAG: rod shape-determining protein MreC [Oscillospiraceae bacterium]|nr:rod shape-determining protein MreC [Oscillospiraceae bacterium]